jgi:hypothetical protein
MTAKNPPIKLNRNQVAFIGEAYPRMADRLPDVRTNLTMAYTPAGRATHWPETMSRHKARRVIKRNGGLFYPRPIVADKGSVLIAFDLYGAPAIYANWDEAARGLIRYVHTSLRIANFCFEAKKYKRCLELLQEVSCVNGILQTKQREVTYLIAAYEIGEVGVRHLEGTMKSPGYDYFRREFDDWAPGLREECLTKLNEFGPMFRQLLSIPYNKESK